MIATKSIVSNVWIMQVELTYKGDTVGDHYHEFDHQHLLAVGEVDISVDGFVTRHKAPKIILIEKDKKHSMTAISDYSLGYCIHPIRNGKRVEDIVAPDVAILDDGVVDNYKTDSGIASVLIKEFDKSFE
jgi:hypothetical protein